MGWGDNRGLLREKEEEEECSLRLVLTAIWTLIYPDPFDPLRVGWKKSREREEEGYADNR